MTRFVTYDAEVAARLAQAVGVHRVELRDSPPFATRFNPALLDFIQNPTRNALLMPSSDEQVLVIHANDETSAPMQKSRKKRAGQVQREIHEIGSQPSGFLGLHDEPVFSDEDEVKDLPRSLWKKEEKED